MAKYADTKTIYTNVLVEHLRQFQHHGYQLGADYTLQQLPLFSQGFPLDIATWQFGVAPIRTQVRSAWMLGVLMCTLFHHWAELF